MNLMSFPVDIIQFPHFITIVIVFGERVFYFVVFITVLLLHKAYVIARTCVFEIINRFKTEANLYSRICIYKSMQKDLIDITTYSMLRGFLLILKIQN